MIALVLLVSGCATFTSLDGGQTLAPGTSHAQVGVTAEVVDGNLSPGVNVVLRRSVASDIDMAFYVRNFVPGVGVRVRTFRSPELSVAVAPQLAGYVNPLGGLFDTDNTGFLANSELQFGAPIIGEYHPGGPLTVAAIVNPGVRLSTIAVRTNGDLFGETASQANLTFGFGSRIGFEGRRIGGTLVLDAVVHTTTPAPLELGASLEFGLRGARWRREARRAAREGGQP